MKATNLKEISYSKVLLYGLIFEIALFSLIISLYFYPWDLLSYLLNGTFLFGNGNYYEVYRPPFLPTLLFFLKFILQNKYFVLGIFIFLSSLFFIYSVEHILKTVNLKNKEQTRLLIFFVLAINPIFISFSFIPSGTEIISVGLVLLGISYIIASHNIKDAIYSGLLFSLSSLTRYNFLLFLPVLILHRDLKKILYSIFSFSIPWFSWLAYNKLTYGKFLYSFVESYFLNVYHRKEMVEPLSFNEFLFLFLILTSTFVFSAYILKRVFSHNLKHKNLLIKLLFIDLYVLLITIYVFATMPFKIERYLYPVSLFTILLVLIYQSVTSQSKQNDSTNSHVLSSNKAYILKRVLLFLVLLFIISKIFYIQYFSFYELKNYYAPIQKEIGVISEYVKRESNNSLCIYSDYWVHYNDRGILSYPEGFLFDNFTKSFTTRNFNDKCSYIILHESKIEVHPYYNERIREVHLEGVEQARVYFILPPQKARNENTQNKYFEKYKDKVVIDNIFWYSLLNNDPNLYDKVCSEIFRGLSFIACR